MQLGPEAAGAQDRRVERVEPVGGGDADHAAVGVEAVHLDEQLVERLLALVVAALRAVAALLAERVELVEEDHRGRVAAGVGEQLAHAGGAAADEHLDEVRAGHAVERHLGLAGQRLREQRLAGAGRAVEDHAAGELCAEALEPLGRLEEHEQVLERVDDLLDTGDVAEAHGRHVGVGDAGAVDLLLAVLTVLVGAVAEQRERDRAEHQHRQQDHRERRQSAGLAAVLDRDLRAGRGEVLSEVLVGRRVLDLDVAAVAELDLGDAPERLQRGGLDGPVGDRVLQRRVAERGGLLRRRRHRRVRGLHGRRGRQKGHDDKGGDQRTTDHLQGDRHDAVRLDQMPSALTKIGIPMMIRIAPTMSKKNPLRTICVIGTTPDP